MEKVLKNVTVVLSIMAVIYGGLSLIPFGPPAMSVSAGEHSVSAAQGSFCWVGFTSSKCVDALSPPELVKYHNLKPIPVSPGEKLKITFQSLPLANTVGISRWISDVDAKAVSLNGNILIAPNEKGMYVYSIYGSWEKGSSGYAFVIEVK